MSSVWKPVPGFSTNCPFLSLTIGSTDFSDLRSFAFVVFDPTDVGREGVDALDVVFALGATLATADDDGLALSSSVELSTDCTTVSSAVDSPTAGATSPLKVHVISALDPEVIADVVEQIPTSVCRKSLRLITCVRV